MMRSLPLLTLMLMFAHRSVVVLSSSAAFVQERSPRRGTLKTAVARSKRKSTRQEAHRGRREVLLATAALVTSAATPQQSSAAAGDQLFKSNPLTNPLLEQVRIWEQAEADELKYGGELEKGNAGNRGRTGAYVKLLVPILEMDQELTALKELLAENSNAAAWKRAQTVLAQPKYDKIAFKKTFNAFGDNIYYSDPDRANLYLAGGATPKTEQSMVYLLRNEILTAIEDLRAELTFVLQNPSQADNNDCKLLSETAAGAMKRYLQVVPPSEMDQARQLLLATTTAQ